MSSAAVLTPKERLEEVFEELAELAGQRNAIDGRIVELVAELDHGNLCGMTGARSVAAVVAWKLGTSTANANTISAVAHRLPEFPRCVAALREGQLSVDQVGVIAERAADGSDEHCAQLAAVATVSQLRKAIKLQPRPPKPGPQPDPPRSIRKTVGDEATTWNITLPNVEAATFDAALQSHHDALIADWKRDHDADSPDNAPPLPSTTDAFMSLIEAGWDTDVERRPHGQRTTVVVHLDVDKRIGELHLGPLLTQADRQYLTCDTTCEVWFERNGQPLGAGRSTRTINRRLRRALEHRDTTCAVPGCGATRGLHAHHIQHWENGGPTELHNLVLLCPYHHRAHHRGDITITGPAHHLTVIDSDGDPLTSRSLARPPNHPPPHVPPCRGPIGERAQWKWYQPFEPKAPPEN
ncbi:HNH endonuclease signature motif containing protein [Mycolicibacterium pallens]|uniref:HNH endonuclease n=1 Tax=Mycolicibacterium pallens TaxID=370524 RepID=A0ABX8VK46_9MYCO|nr:HNH endonuclease signature motif containing protein [Mycolicibacterium pallens]QYL18180.1 HNH endonuclease [Mycolicibacterium pallens]